MPKTKRSIVPEAKQAALEVLLHNMHGPYHGLPRTAGWGYPEPYTRDLMISGLGMLASGNERLIACLRRVLETLASNQTGRGHMPSLVHDKEDRGSSDATPLFLMTTALYRQVVGEPYFLGDAVAKARTWMDYQSPSDRVMVGQLPTSDWRDEHWVLGFGLFVNAVLYADLLLYKDHGKAEMLRKLMTRFVIGAEAQHRHVHEGLAVPHKPYYALWSYKVMDDERFDLLGNSIAIIAGLPSPSRARSIVSWVEHECAALRERGELKCELPPCLIPFIRPEDPDWRGRYARYNRPGDYHNGGIWPFICGFYVVAALAAGATRTAENALEALARLVKPAREKDVAFGFNEWFKAQTGEPMGQDWQMWSAALYLYAAECVEQKKVLFFEEIRKRQSEEE